MLQGQYRFQMGMSGHSDRGQYVYDAVMNNGCMRYTPQSGGGDSDADTTIAVYPLNPFMFLPRTALQDKRLPEMIAHRPFWW